jgi:GGDEF domain-containing protein
LCDYSNDDESFDTIYVRADSAMYKSKKDNSDVKFYHNELVGNL